MRRLFIILLSFALALPLCAQQKKTSVKKNTATTTTTNKKTTATTSKKKTTKKTGKKNTTTNVSTPTIKNLQNENKKVQAKIKEQEQLLKKNKADVQQRLKNLMVINSEITQKQKNIEDIQKDIEGLDENIELLNTQLSTLEKQLEERKAKYIKSLRYMARHRNVQDDIMFIFSSENLAQMYRRMRFVREYATYQRVQGEQVKAKQEQIAAKHNELKKVKGEKNYLLNKGTKEKVALEGKQEEQKSVVNSLQKQQKTIQQVITEQRKKSDELNAQIDRLVAEEVAKARARAEAEAKKKAAEEKKRKEEELARKQALAEAAARENAKRVAEARKREAEAKAAARDAAKKSDKEKAKADQAARAAEADREAAELKEKIDNERNKKEVDRVREESKNVTMLSSVDRKLSSNFESNRGRLPIPITGSYRIISHFGQYAVAGLKDVHLDNKGITIQGNGGAQARCIFDGEVSAVVNIGGTMLVMVRHGKYISVYSNLRSVSVRKGQHVNTRQALGSLGTDNILQFQLRREIDKLNPEAWLGK